MEILPEQILQVEKQLLIWLQSKSMKGTMEGRLSEMFSLQWSPCHRVTGLLISPNMIHGNVRNTTLFSSFLSVLRRESGPSGGPIPGAYISAQVLVFMTSSTWTVELAVPLEGCVNCFLQIPFNRDNGPVFRAIDKNESLQFLKNKKRFYWIYSTSSFSSLGKILIQLRLKYG